MTQTVVANEIEILSYKVQSFLSVLENAAICAKYKNLRLGADGTDYHEVSIDHALVGLYNELIRARMSKKFFRLQDDTAHPLNPKLHGDFIIDHRQLHLVYNEKPNGSKTIKLIDQLKEISFHYGSYIDDAFYVHCGKVTDVTSNGKTWFVPKENRIETTSKGNFHTYREFAKQYPYRDFMGLLEEFMQNAQLFKNSRKGYEKLPDLKKIYPDLNTELDEVIVDIGNPEYIEWLQKNQPSVLQNHCELMQSLMR